MRVLVVEDSRIVRESLCTALKKSGYAVDATGDGLEGSWFAESHDYDAIILDLMLPGRNGLAVLQRLRERGCTTHVLLLTAKDAVDDRVRGLRAGADDYVVKPFSLDELLARVAALCRRGYGRKSASVTIGDLTIDTVGKHVQRGSCKVELTAREFRMLEYLAMRHGEVVARKDIEAHAYGDSDDPLSNVVDSTICSLRKKLAVPGGADIIHTRRGLGYILDVANP